MIINRRELLKKTAWGGVGLSLTPNFNHLFGKTSLVANGYPHRFIFIRKSNGNLPSQFGLPSFSEDEAKKHKGKEPFDLDLSKHELPDWLESLDQYKENMTILHGISMCVSGGGHYSYSGCMGAFKA